MIEESVDGGAELVKDYERKTPATIISRACPSLRRRNMS